MELGERWVPQPCNYAFRNQEDLDIAEVAT